MNKQSTEFSRGTLVEAALMLINFELDSKFNFAAGEVAKNVVRAEFKRVLQNEMQIFDTSINNDLTLFVIAKAIVFAGLGFVPESRS